ncbi:MAG: hypothetical protein U0790_00265 [Isosphaeraceae bacterium]
MTSRERTLLLIPNRQLLILQRLVRASCPTTGRIDGEALERERRSFPDHIQALIDDGWIEPASEGPGFLLAGDDPASDPFAFPVPTRPRTPPAAKGAPECAPSPPPNPARR